MCSRCGRRDVDDFCISCGWENLWTERKVGRVLACLKSANGLQILPDGTTQLIVRDGRSYVELHNVGTLRA